MVRSGAFETTLGRDKHALVGMQCLADQLFRNIGAVGIRGIDKVHANFRQPLQRADSFRAVLRLAPDAVAGDTHGAEAKTVNFDVAADLKAAGLAGVELAHVWVPNILWYRSIATNPSMPRILIAAHSS